MTEPTREKLEYLVVMMAGSALESAHIGKYYTVQTNCHALKGDLLHDK
jgi:hypothetical protein